MLANHKLVGVGVSGDGDTASIGLGQFMHMVRRNIPMLYIIENNGVYGLTKGQFSATADEGSKLKTGVINDLPPMDLCALAVELGCGFVARGFAGDPKQMVNILKGALAHDGMCVIDVISPCVTFNDHEGSTKSYAYTREHNVEIVQADFVPPAAEIEAEYEAGTVRNVMMHDGSWVRLRKVAEDYDATDRDRAYAYIRERQAAGEIVTGLLFLSPDSRDMHAQSDTVPGPLVQVPYEQLCPGNAELQRMQQRFR